MFIREHVVAILVVGLFPTNKEDKVTTQPWWRTSRCLLRNVKDTLTYFTPQLSSFTPWHLIGLFTSGVDILGPFPRALGQLKCTIARVDYFIKWIEAEAIEKIIGVRIFRFYWQKITCRFILLGFIISNNIIEFACTTFTDFFHEVWLQTKFIFVAHPHTNGHVDSTNKVIERDQEKVGWYQKVVGWIIPWDIMIV